MTQEEYMETIIELIIMARSNLAGDKERLFKAKAKKHNPPISDQIIDDFWNANSSRV